MKCTSCSVEVPPAFSKALIDNICPACGKEIFKTTDFKEFLRIKDILKDAGLDDKITITVAAIVSNKYDITLKNTTVARKEQLTTEDINTTIGLSEEERMKLRALHAAQQEINEKRSSQIKEEWGMNHGDLAASAVRPNDKKLINPELASLFSDMQSGDSDMLEPPLDIKSTGLSPQNSDRLARAEAMRGDPSRFKITRIE